MRRARPALAMLLLTGGCTAGWYHDSADREVDEILGEFQQKGLADRASRVQIPKPEQPVAPAAAGAAGAGAAVDGATPPAGADAPAESGAAAPAAKKGPLRLDLRTALQLAVGGSRDYKTQRESLYLTGLGFSLTRFHYGPQFTSAVNYVWSESDGANPASSIGGSFGVSQLLPTNGTLGLSTGVSQVIQDGGGGGNADWSTSTGISLSQPLLRNAGYDLYRESLTQAERSLVYAVRDFELYREQFTIDTTQSFFSLVGEQRKLANVELDLESARNDEAESEALRKVERKTDEDVIRARRRRLDQESAVDDFRVRFRRQVERFLIDLGLDPKTPVEFVDEEPPFEPVAFDTASAVESALANRLDVQTRREQIEDAERRFRLARNDLLPDLNLNASYGSGGSGRHPGSALPDTWSKSAGVSLEIPLQTIDRRNAWRQAEIEIDRTRRGWDEYIDNLRANVEDALRQLKSTERQLEIAYQSQADEEHALIRLKLLAERGDVSNRDLLEARQKRITVQNNIIDQKVSHLIQRLRLYKDLGILFIGSDGRWSIGAPAVEGDDPAAPSQQQQQQQDSPAAPPKAEAPARPDGTDSQQNEPKEGSR